MIKLLILWMLLLVGTFPMMLFIKLNRKQITFLKAFLYSNLGNYSIFMVILVFLQSFHRKATLLPVKLFIAYELTLTVFFVFETLYLIKEKNSRLLELYGIQKRSEKRKVDFVTPVLFLLAFIYFSLIRENQLISYTADIASVKKAGVILTDVTVMSGYYFSEILKLDPRTVLGCGYGFLIWLISYGLITLIADAVCRVTYLNDNLKIEKTKNYFVKKTCLAIVCISLNLIYARHHMVENGTFCHAFFELYVIPSLMLSVMVSAWIMEQWKKDMVIEVLLLFVIDWILCGCISGVLILVFIMGVVAYFVKRLFKYKILSPILALLLGIYLVCFMNIEFMTDFVDLNTAYLSEYDELYSAIETEEVHKILAPNNILRFIRTKNEEINMLYEVPIMESIYRENFYDQKVCAVFEEMVDPENRLGGIVPVAIGNQCDCLILPLYADERWEMEMGGFEVKKETENYVLYFYRN